MSAPGQARVLSFEDRVRGTLDFNQQLIALRQPKEAERKDLNSKFDALKDIVKGIIRDFHKEKPDAMTSLAELARFLESHHKNLHTKLEHTNDNVTGLIDAITAKVTDVTARVLALNPKSFQVPSPAGAGAASRPVPMPQDLQQFFHNQLEWYAKKRYDDLLAAMDLLIHPVQKLTFHIDYFDRTLIAADCDPKNPHTVKVLDKIENPKCKEMMQRVLKTLEDPNARAAFVPLRKIANDISILVEQVRTPLRQKKQIEEIDLFIRFMRTQIALIDKEIYKREEGEAGASAAGSEAHSKEGDQKADRDMQAIQEDAVYLAIMVEINDAKYIEEYNKVLTLLEDRPEDALSEKIEFEVFKLLANKAKSLKPEACQDLLVWCQGLMPAPSDKNRRQYEEVFVEARYNVLANKIKEGIDACAKAEGDLALFALHRLKSQFEQYTNIPVKPEKAHAPVSPANPAAGAASLAVRVASSALVDEALLRIMRQAGVQVVNVVPPATSSPEVEAVKQQQAIVIRHIQNYITHVGKFPSDNSKIIGFNMIFNYFEIFKAEVKKVLPVANVSAEAELKEERVARKVVDFDAHTRMECLHLLEIIGKQVHACLDLLKKCKPQEVTVVIMNMLAAIKPLKMEALVAYERCQLSPKQHYLVNYAEWCKTARFDELLAGHEYFVGHEKCLYQLDVFQRTLYATKGDPNNPHTSKVVEKIADPNIKAVMGRILDALRSGGLRITDESIRNKIIQLSKSRSEIERKIRESIQAKRGKPEEYLQAIQNYVSFLNKEIKLIESEIARREPRNEREAKSAASGPAKAAAAPAGIAVAAASAPAKASEADGKEGDSKAMLEDPVYVSLMIDLRDARQADDVMDAIRMLIHRPRDKLSDLIAVEALKVIVDKAKAENEGIRAIYIDLCRRIVMSTIRDKQLMGLCEELVGEVQYIDLDRLIRELIIMNALHNGEFALLGLYKLRTYLHMSIFDVEVLYQNIAH